MKRLMAQLQAQTAQAHKLNEAIARNLKELVHFQDTSWGIARGSS